jgi:hypothetical protein
MHKAKVASGEGGRALGRVERLADANDRARPTEARAVDDFVAIGVEGRIGEVCVAVDERRRQRAPAVSLTRPWR